MTFSASLINQWLDTAKACAHKAGAIISKEWGSPHVISRKEASIDLVTEVDKTAEEAIIQDLVRIYPHHSILAEETGRQQGIDTDFLWVIDPLDGTTNFTHHYPQVAVSIALLHQNQPIIGVVYNPITQELFHAAKGLGVFLNGNPLQVSKVNSLDKSLLATGFPYDRQTNPDNNYAEFCALTQSSQGVRRGGSAALDLAYVAAGRLDGYWERGIKPWDIAAGVLLVEEAGGQVSHYDMQPLNLFSGFILATNGHCHSLLSEKIVQVRSRPGYIINS